MEGNKTCCKEGVKHGLDKWAVRRLLGWSKRISEEETSRSRGGPNVRGNLHTTSGAHTFCGNGERNFCGDRGRAWGGVRRLVVREGEGFGVQNM